MMAVIELKNVTKDFKIRESVSLKEFVRNFFRFKTIDRINIIKNCSIELNKGDIVGVIGRNGVGKTTFLRLLCGILSPSSGKIKVNGKIAPLLSLGASFNEELTPVQNIELFSMLLDVKQKVDINRVFEMAQIDISLKNEKMKFFSSGMKAKIKFIASLLNDANILLLDEIFAVGDHAFQQKAKELILEHMLQKELVVMVSHDLDLVKNICNKILYIKEDGSYEYSSNIESTIKGYLDE